jgi:4-hydroxy-tetrahydrodipicolinate reductase
VIRIAVNGALGRMGNRILALAAESKGFEIAGRYDAKPDAAARVETLSSAALKGKGVLIDFSSSEGAVLAMQAAIEAKWSLVVGTTGLDDNALDGLAAASRKIPVVFSSNMSIGVNVVLGLLESAAKRLPEEFNIRMTEAHHIHKKDAPSGTALMLARQVAAAKNWFVDDLIKSWRAGKFNQPGDKMMMKVIREGEIVGDHTVLFEGPAETIEITHRAKSRDTFARGALAAASFAATAKPGKVYSMADVLR